MEQKKEYQDTAATVQAQKDEQERREEEERRQKDAKIASLKDKNKREGKKAG